MSTFNSDVLLKRGLHGAVAVTLLVCLGACSNKEPEREVMPVKDTVFAPQVQALDKAKGVQDTLDKSAAQTEAALQDQPQ
jgi:hypothetical protein